MIEWVMFMKKFAETAAKVLKIAVLLAAAAFCMARTELVGAAVGEAVQRCLTTVIPSLYAMMIVSALIVRSGICGCIPRFAARLSRRITGMDGTAAAIFAVGTFAGYPVGTSMLLSEFSQGRLTKRQTEILSGLCFGAGPAFIFGCISGKLYSSSTAGIIIILSTAAANLIAMLLVSPILRRFKGSERSGEGVSLTAEMLTESIVSSGAALGKICFSVTAFAVISAFLTSLGISGAVGEGLSRVTGLDGRTCEQLFAAFLDVTNVSGLPRDDFALLPFVCGLTSFGGVCVMFQLGALIGKRISMRILVGMRLFTGVISGVVCRVIMPWVMRNELVSAVRMNGVRVSREVSVVPSVMLGIMTVMVIGEYGKLKEKRK